MNKKGYIILCILVVLFILAIIVLFEKYVISANLQEGATNNFSSYFVPIEEVKKELKSFKDNEKKNYNAYPPNTVFLTKNLSLKPNANLANIIPEKKIQSYAESAAIASANQG